MTVKKSKRKSPRKKKAKTGADIKQDCYKAIQRLARIAAADDDGYCACVSCGIIKHYKEQQGGHFIPKGNSSYYALDVTNVHPQCTGCNMWGMKHGSAAQEYTLYMEDMYGRQYVEEMLANKTKPIKRYKADYQDMLNEFNELIKFHQERIKE